MNFDYVKEQFGGGTSFRVVNPQIRDQFLRVINRMYGVRNDLQRKFPGAQPCSVMRDNLERLSRDHYVVAEKTDGTRYLMLVTRNRDTQSDFVVMIDRSLTMWIVQLDFADVVHTSCTLFDGELVHNEVEQRWMYQIFDLIGSGREFRPRDTYVQRLKNARVIIDRYHRPNAQHDAFQMLVKRFYPTYEIDQLLPSVQMHQGCRTDGLIFTPVNMPVKPYRNRAMFKWKQQDDHTIDCLLRYNAKKALRMRAQTLDQDTALVDRRPAQLDAAQQNVVSTPVKQEASASRKRPQQQTDKDETAAPPPTKKRAKLCASASVEAEDDDYDSTKAPQRRRVYCGLHKDSSSGIVALYEQQQQRREAQQQASLIVELDSASVSSVVSEDDDKDDADDDSSALGATLQQTPERSRVRIQMSTLAASSERLEASDAVQGNAIVPQADVETRRQNNSAQTVCSSGGGNVAHSISPSRIELAAFELWLNDSRNKLVRHRDVDAALNRAFLIENGLDIVAGNEPIVECRYDLQAHDWRILWIRTDRTSPNTEFTVQKTTENIEENITLDEIARVARNNRPPASSTPFRHNERVQGGANSAARPPHTVPHNPFANNDFEMHGASGSMQQSWHQHHHQQHQHQQPYPFANTRTTQRSQYGPYGPSSSATHYDGEHGPVPMQRRSSPMQQAASPSFMHPDRQAAFMSSQSSDAYGGYPSINHSAALPQHMVRPRHHQASFAPPPAGYDQAYLPSPDHHYSPSQSYDWPLQQPTHHHRQRRTSRSSNNGETSVGRAYETRPQDDHQRTRSPSMSPPPAVEEYDPTNPGMANINVEAAILPALSTQTAQPDVGSLLSQLSASLQSNPHSALGKALGASIKP